MVFVSLVVYGALDCLLPCAGRQSLIVRCLDQLHMLMRTSLDLRCRCRRPSTACAIYCGAFGLWVAVKICS